MPSEMIQESQSNEEVKYDCDKFVANAAVYGDQFQWHVDADPWTFHEDSKFVQRFGNYFNGVMNNHQIFLLEYLVIGT